MDGTSEPRTPRLTHSVAILLIPLSAGCLWFHGAATQDGPSHIAAAKIANQWVRQFTGLDPAGSVLAATRLQVEPVPNWGGQALGMALVAILPVGLAEVVMNLAGLWLPAVALARLIETATKPGHKATLPRMRYDRIRKPHLQNAFLAFWVATITTNVLWTFGFSSFLFGLGMAWTFLAALLKFGETGGRGSWLILASLWCITFLCHLVAFAIAGIVSACLVVFRPRWPIARRGAIVACMATALPLVLRYRTITGESPLEPAWEHLNGSEMLSLANWARQLGWVDPLSLHSKTWHPIVENAGLGAIAFQPALWVAIAAGMLIRPMYRCVIHEFRKQIRFVEATTCIIGVDERGQCIGRDAFMAKARANARFLSRFLDGRLPASVAWSIAMAILVILGTLGPDSLGPGQGHYLPQRFCLAALSLVPVCLASERCQVPKLVMCLIAIAWMMQTVSAIEFVSRSHAITRPVRLDRAEIRPGERIVALVDATAWPYRANPRLHADALLVTCAHDTISWNLYEAGHPYFPLRFQVIYPGMDPMTLEAFSLDTKAAAAQHAADTTKAILRAADGLVDVVYVWMDMASSRRTVVSDTIESQSGWIRARASRHSIIYRRKSGRRADERLPTSEKPSSRSS